MADKRTLNDVEMLQRKIARYADCIIFLTGFIAGFTLGVLIFA